MRSLEALGGWIDQRTGLRTGARTWMASRAAVVDAGTLFFTTAVATCFVLLAVTGVILMTAYAPSPQSAWASVHYIQFVLSHGWIVRGLHYWAAQALFVVSVAHIVYGAFAGTYRSRREIGWWLTLLVAAFTVGLGITGGLLPWDQKGWWARTVEGNIVGLAPVFGSWLQEMMSGGAELGALGLSRAYAMHVVLLPVALLAVLWARHALSLRSAGVPGAPSRVERLVPIAGVAIASLFVIFALTGAVHGAPLDAPADPMSDYPARPEWSLLVLYELRKFFHGAGEFWGTTLIPAAAGAYLALLPWIDRPTRSRTVALAPVAVIFGSALVLAVAAARHDARDPQFARMNARAEAEASAAAKLAMQGVPPAGALEMMREDPELHGRALFEKHCASCHVLGDLGDPKKATATKLDGWGTVAWIEAMIHQPDAIQFFGRGPYAGQMPSVDVRPADSKAAEGWSAMIKNDAEKHAVAVFLASQGDDPGGPPRAEENLLAQGAKIVSERCTACHLYKGDGDDDGSGLAPELSRYGSLDWTMAQVANPATSRTYRDKALDAALKKHMPRFDKDLTKADVEAVAGWTRAHGRGLSLP